MNKKISLSVLMLLVLSTFGGVASRVEFGVVESSQVVQAVPNMESFDMQNFTKLEISPRYIAFTDEKIQMNGKWYRYGMKMRE